MALYNTVARLGLFLSTGRGPNSVIFSPTRYNQGPASAMALRHRPQYSLLFIAIYTTAAGIIKYANGYYIFAFFNQICRHRITAHRSIALCCANFFTVKPRNVVVVNWSKVNFMLFPAILRVKPLFS